MDSNPAYQALGRAEVDVLNSCVNAKLKLAESEDELNVCEAIQTLIDRAVKKAEEEAREKEKAAKEAAEKAAKEAERKRISDLQNAVENLMNNMNLSAEEAMKAMGIAEGDCKVLRELCGTEIADFEKHTDY